jgi:hypothetical protein
MEGVRDWRLADGNFSEVFKVFNIGAAVVNAGDLGII